jgi:hypothetical protein
MVMSMSVYIKIDESALKTKLSSIDSAIVKLTTRIVSLEAIAVSLKSRVAALEALPTQSTNVTELQARVERLEKMLTTSL